MFKVSFNNETVRASKKFFLKFVRASKFVSLRKYFSNILSSLLVKKYSVKSFLFKLENFQFKREILKRLKKLRYIIISWLCIFKNLTKISSYYSRDLISIMLSKVLKNNLRDLKQPEFIDRIKNWNGIFLTSLIVIKKLITRVLFDLTKYPKLTEPKISTEKSLHWLLKSKTIQNLWIGGSFILVLLILLEYLINSAGYFGIDDTFGFNAWYGFIVCIVLVFMAKGLGVLLKRMDTYYEHD